MLKGKVINSSYVKGVSKKIVTADISQEGVIRVH